MTYAVAFFSKPAFTAVVCWTDTSIPSSVCCVYTGTWLLFACESKNTKSNRCLLQYAVSTPQTCKSCVHCLICFAKSSTFTYRKNNQSMRKDTFIFLHIISKPVAPQARFDGWRQRALHTKALLMTPLTYAVHSFTSMICGLLSWLMVAACSRLSAGCAAGYDLCQNNHRTTVKTITGSDP